MPISDDRDPLIPASPTTAAVPASLPGTTPILAPRPDADGDEQPPAASRRFIILILLAIFGTQMASVTPIAFSLAIRVDHLAPGREQYLGYVTGIGAFISLLALPLYGGLSDRTRHRLGRRRPWLGVLVLAGIPALLLTALAPTIPVLCIGWILTVLTWGQTGSILQMSQADWLAPTQRGKVAGAAGLMSPLASIIGVVIAGTVSHSSLLLFLVPGFIGVALALPFVVLFPDRDSRGHATPPPLSVIRIARNYRFSFKRERDFSVNLIVRFLFTLGIYLSTTFTSFYLAQVTGRPVADIGSTIAVLGGIGILAAMSGALGSGWLSDRIGRRKPIIAAAGTLFLLGSIVIALADDLTLFYAGAVLTNLALGSFGSVDQALMLDVLPNKAEAGRFVGITSAALNLAHSLAPLIAPVFLLLGTGAEKNYAALYLAAGICTTLSAAAVLMIRGAR